MPVPVKKLNFTYEYLLEEVAKDEGIEPETRELAREKLRQLKKEGSDGEDRSK